MHRLAPAETARRFAGVGPAVLWALVLTTVLSTAIVLAIGQPLVLAAIPVAVVGAIACAMFPAPVMLAIFFISGTIGSLTAFVPILPATNIADALLGGLWLGAVGTYLTGRARRFPWFWPAAIAMGVFLTINAIEILFTDPIDLGLVDFKSASWYMAAVLLVAIAPWSRKTYARIAQGIAVLAVVIGAYAVIRWIIGSDPQEILVSRRAQPGIPGPVKGRFAGSMLSANQLAAWAGTALPFCLALVLGWRGWWRLIAAAAVPLLAIAIFASDVRTGILAVAVGVVVVLLLTLLIPAQRRRRTTVLAAILLVAVVGGAAYEIVIAGSPEKSERFSRIFDLGNDPAYSDRLVRWSAAWEDITEEHPWGHGLGTSGAGARNNPNGPVITTHLDSSYLQVGLEQGLAMMILYAFSLVALLVGLARRATLMTDPAKAALTVGASGTLATLIVLFYGSTYSEGTYISGAWLIVGLGVAQVTMRARGPRAAPAARARRTVPPARTPRPVPVASGLRPMASRASRLE